MVLERTSVSLDVHARSIVAGVLDTLTGQVWSRRLPPAPRRWSSGVVVAPSKLERPFGTGSRPTGATPNAWPGCSTSGSSPRCGFPPSFEEGARDLVRAGEDARTDLMRARHRLSKLLLRDGLVFEGAAWTQAHQRWLQTQSQQLTRYGLRVAPFDEAEGAVLAVQARRGRLDAAIVELAMTPPWALVVGRLGRLRGIGVLTGFGLAVEIGDWQRFTGARIGAYLGLVPTEQSSSTQRVQGSITKTGNSHAPPAAGRGSLAPPQALSSQPGPACPPG